MNVVTYTIPNDALYTASAIWFGHRTRVPRPQTKQSSETIAEEVLGADGTTVVVSPSKQGGDEGAPKKESEGEKEPAVEDERQSMSGDGQAQKGNVKPGFEFTPNAPAWTPGGVATDVVEEKISPVAVPPDKAEGTTSATASSKTIPKEGGGRDVGGSSVADEPKVPAAELNP